MLAYQWDKLARPVLFDSMPVLSLYHPDKFLCLARFSDRNDQATTDFQLRD
jgi:hypothetical protein